MSVAESQTGMCAMCAAIATRAVSARRLNWRSSSRIGKQGQGTQAGMPVRVAEARSDALAGEDQGIAQHGLLGGEHPGRQSGNACLMVESGQFRVVEIAVVVDHALAF